MGRDQGSASGGQLTLSRPQSRPLTQPPATAALRRGPRELAVPIRIRRSVFLILITLIAPGSAQLAAGDRRVGRVAIRVWLSLLATLAVTGLLWLTARPVVLWLATNAVVLYLLAGVLFALALLWPLLVVDAWRLGRPALLPRPVRLRITALLVLAMALAGVPAYGAANRLSAAAGVLDSVFGSGRTSAATAGRYNVLLLGGDAGAGRVGTRPDSMTLASIDASTGRTVLFSLPRNLENVRFPDGTPAAKALPRGWTCGDQCLLNGLYTWGTQHSQAFPGAKDPGGEAMKQAASWVTGLQVNYYVLIDLTGFRRIIDAMGGVKLTVRERVPIGGGTSRVSGYIEPGTQVLDGYHALWYARSRHGANDYARMQRQKCVMNAMVQQLDPATLLSKFQQIASAASEVMSTDLPSSQLATFIDLGARAKSQKLTNVSFVPPVIQPAYPDFGVIHQRVIDALIASRQAPAKNSAIKAATSTTKPTAHSTASSGATGAASPSGQAVADDVQAACSVG